MHTSFHPQESRKFQENEVPIVNVVDEQAQHVVGEFSDARLKKTVCLRKLGGTVGNGKDVGMFIHPLLSVDADDGSCLGLAHLHRWCRTAKAAPKYRVLPIEEKEHEPI